jgi:nitrogen fixation NifU-like protein
MSPATKKVAKRLVARPRSRLRPSVPAKQLAENVPMDSGYEQHVLQHYGDPYHKGDSPVPPTHTLSSASDVCGDEVTFKLRITDGHITDIWWTGDGCCFSQAAASMVAEQFDGKTIRDVRAFTTDDMLSLFQANVSTSRLGCVLVAFNALRQLEN